MGQAGLFATPAMDTGTAVPPAPVAKGTPFDLHVPPAGATVRVAGLPGCAEALALARLGTRRRTIALTPDAGMAARLVDQLRALMDPAAVRHLVGWEVLPYDVTSPPRASVSLRVAALAALARGQPGVYVGTITDTLLPCAPPRQLAGRALQVAVGEKVSLARLARDLAAAGCANVDRVRAAGEFAVYGGQMDLYPGGAAQPYRLVLDEDTVAQVRTFDPVTQLSTGNCERIELLPSREYPLDTDTVADFRQRWLERFPPGASEELYRQVSEGREAEGAEFFLPLFHGARASLFDYLTRRDVLWLHEGWQDALAGFADLVAERHVAATLAGQAALPPEEVFLTPAAARTRVSEMPALEIVASGTGDVDVGARELPPLAARRGGGAPYDRLATWLGEGHGRVVFPWAGVSRRERVAAAVAAAGATAAATDAVTGARHGCFLLEAPLSGGFVLPGARLAVVTEAELHGYVPAPQVRNRQVAGNQELLDDLVPGSLVVHRDHGVARFLGLHAMRHDDGSEDEFIELEFANDVRLHVAVAHCHLVTRLRQPVPGEEPKLHVMGGARWKSQRAKAERAARDTAAHLLAIYARRAAAAGRPPLAVPEDDYVAFCDAFEHVETTDQGRVAAEIAVDMAGTRPMDRLVCGDVGFGKTEVAMRAAWLAWSAGRQVAVVAPTTLLADQLLDSFIDRFAGTGARIVGMSSLQGAAGNEAARLALAAATADIAVGTHALLGRKVSLPNLGLLIIDEEHRFGVRQKERLRELRADADVLALSATPIPRTLSMALEGLRDMSLLASPPSDRLEVRTFVTRDDDSVMREALTRERARGGQAFVVHHRVQTIGAMADRVTALLPGAVVEVAHGQMPPSRLEEIMRRFYRGAIDVLVCTTIIESGIDVPNANTMVVPRADMFGLAQLHQLRGRVGRAARQAYAYLLTTGDRREQRTVAARLDILTETTGLGGGYQVAERDLEIRGAGELLGDAQSGAVTAVGIETFRRMLDAAVRAGRGDPPAVTCAVDFGPQARLPANYCANPVERMRLYRRLAATSDVAEVEALRDEIADRFGPPPIEARLLLDVARLRLAAAALGATTVEASHNALRLGFGSATTCAERLVAYVTRQPGCRLGPDGVLRIPADGDMPAKMALAFDVCAALAGPAAG